MPAPLAPSPAIRLTLPPCALLTYQIHIPSPAQRVAAAASAIGGVTGAGSGVGRPGASDWPAQERRRDRAAQAAATGM